MSAPPPPPPNVQTVWCLKTDYNGTHLPGTAPPAVPAAPPSIIMTAKDRMEFHQQCVGLQRNDPNYQVMDFDYFVLDDEMCQQLGHALVRNTHVKMVRFVVGPSVTANIGIKALVNGIQQAQISYPAIERQHGDFSDLPLEMSDLYIHAMKRAADNIGLTFPIDDGHAACIAKAMNRNQRLVKVVLNLHPENFSTVGAKSLSKGIRNTNIKSVELLLAPTMLDTNTNMSPTLVEALRVFYTEGVTRCKSMQEFIVIGGVGDMTAFTSIFPTLIQFALKQVQLSVADYEIFTKAMMQTFPVTANPKNDHRLYLLTLQLRQLTPEGALALAPALKRSNILNLDLEIEPNVGDENQVMDTICQQGLRGSKRIIILTLRKGGTISNIPALVAALIRMPRLYKFAIEDAVLSVADTKLLIECIMKCPKLHTLCLKRCQLNNDHLYELAAGLTTHPSLKEVDVSHNLIGNAGLERMMLVFPRPTFEWNLAMNQFHGTVRLPDAASNEPMYARFN